MCLLGDGTSPSPSSAAVQAVQLDSAEHGCHVGELLGPNRRQEAFFCHVSGMSNTLHVHVQCVLIVFYITEDLCVFI